MNTDFIRINLINSKIRQKKRTKNVTSLVIKSLIVACTVFSFAKSRADVTGYPDDFNIDITFNKICLKNQPLKQLKSKKLAILLKVFYLELDSDFESLRDEIDASLRIEESLSEDSKFPISEFTYSEDLTPGLLPDIKGKELNFEENNTITIPFFPINSTIRLLNTKTLADLLYKDKAEALGRAFKANFKNRNEVSETELKPTGVLGLAVKLFDTSTMTTVTTSLVAFKNPNYKNANHSLLEDYKGDLSEHAPIHRIYPSIATLLNSRRRFLTYDGEHKPIDNDEDYACNGSHRVLDFELEVYE